ncbi:hypothetical protein LVD15_26265 [Fulvivirga maritima]|uniref:ExbD/TolR family protein n=1 Tax=Fulvivirga maritima TaxID=2904247 RepID=UPI001F34147A|nr:hypothetical protein [Fulvivirga maritima]UII26758.1 hypothetical protein LVD15_26265 [Fulvivirga maritima]
MKYLSGIILALICISCEKSYNYTFEDKILNCFYDQYRGYGIDVKASIDSAQNILLRHGIIHEPTGQSYYHFLLVIAETNDLPVLANEDIQYELNNIKYLPTSINCRDSTLIQLESSEYYNSKYSLLIAVFDSIGSKGNITPSIVAKELLKVFEPTDLNHDLYNHIGTLMISNLIKSNFNSQLGLKPESVKPRLLEKYDSLNILITADELLYLNNRQTDISKAKGIIKDFVIRHGETHLLTLNYSRKASYDIFISTLDIIQQAYKEIKGEHPDISTNLSVADPSL